MIKTLEQYGFSKNKANVYLALLDIGATTAGAIIKKTGLHRNIVYENLDTLLAEKLISQTIRGGKKFFGPLDPTVILHNAKEKMGLATSIVHQLTAKIKKEKQQIVIYEGADEYIRFHLQRLDELPRGSTYYVLGVSGRWYKDVMADVLTKYEAKRIKHNVKTKLIYYSRQYAIDKENDKKRQLSESRVIHNQSEAPSTTVIWPDGIDIQINSDPIVNIHIKNKEVAKSYLDYFNLMWKLGKKTI